MANTWQGITRTVALWVLIICGGAVATIAFLRGEAFLGLFIVGLFVTVIMDEIRGKILKKQTVSQQWTAWIERDPWFAYTATILLAIGLLALPIHFIFR